MKVYNINYQARVEELRENYYKVLAEIDKKPSYEKMSILCDKALRIDAELNQIKRDIKIIKNNLL